MFDILITTYNREKYLDRCLRSVINQENAPSYNIYIIDDKSKDKTLEISQKYQKKYPNLITIVENNEHTAKPGLLMNKMLKEAKNPYFIELDDDDQFFPTTLKEFYTKIKEIGPNFGLIYANQCFLDNDGRKNANTACSLELTIENLQKYIPIRHPICYNREITESLGNFDENSKYATPSNLIFRVYKTKKPIYHINKYLYIYDYSNHDQISRTNREEQKKEFEENGKILS